MESCLYTGNLWNKERRCSSGKESIDKQLHTFPIFKPLETRLWWMCESLRTTDGWRQTHLVKLRVILWITFSRDGTERQREGQLWRGCQGLFPFNLMRFREKSERKKQDRSPLLTLVIREKRFPCIIQDWRGWKKQLEKLVSHFLLASSIPAFCNICLRYFSFHFIFFISSPFSLISFHFTKNTLCVLSVSLPGGRRKMRTHSFWKEKGIWLMAHQIRH